uniref:Uncharacterized protein n=1 Tax=Lutzomyia longipalpis TaxID=7200 RepID=A0A1B0CE76_LUTLO
MSKTQITTVLGSAVLYAVVRKWGPQLPIRWQTLLRFRRIGKIRSPTPPLSETHVVSYEAHQEYGGASTNLNSTT